RDPPLGTAGLTITANPPYDGTEGSDLTAVALQPDGKIVVGGHMHPVAGRGEDLAVERYSTGGSLDPAFGTNGVVTTDLGADWERVLGLAIQPDGKIVAAGTFGGAVARARHNPGATREAPLR